MAPSSEELGPPTIPGRISEASDYNTFKPLLEIPIGRPRLILADKGYDGDAIREAPTSSRHPADDSAEIEPQIACTLRLPRLKGPQPHRADVQ